MKQIKIYACGSVKKGKEDDKVSWTDEDMEMFKARLSPTNVYFIDPRYKNPKLRRDFAAFFGRDLMAVKLSDFVVVDARQKRGIGVGQEMMFAKLEKIPVVTVAPQKSHYIKENIEYLGEVIPKYIHPFLFATSDVIVENFEEAAQWIKDFLESPKEIKDGSIMKSAMDLYLKEYFEEDEPLKNAVKEADNE